MKVVAWIILVAFVTWLAINTLCECGRPKYPPLGEEGDEP